MENNGFLVIHMKEHKGYAVTDYSQVGKLVGADPRTVRRWFEKGKKRFRIEGYWIIQQGYEVMKSARGGKEFKETREERDKEKHAKAIEGVIANAIIGGYYSEKEGI